MIEGSCHCGAVRWRFKVIPESATACNWRGLAPDRNGHCRIAVNLRLAEPEAVAAINVNHFDGLESWKRLPDDGRCVTDMWF